MVLGVDKLRRALRWLPQVVYWSVLLGLIVVAFVSVVPQVFWPGKAGKFGPSPIHRSLKGKLFTDALPSHRSQSCGDVIDAARAQWFDWASVMITDPRGFTDIEIDQNRWLNAWDTNVAHLRERCTAAEQQASLFQLIRFRHRGVVLLERWRAELVKLDEKR